MSQKQPSLLERMRQGEKLTAAQQLELVVTLSIPAIMAQITSIVMQYIDASMVGSLGADASASIGLVSSSTWLFGGITGAVASGFSIQAAHKIGAGREDEARSIMRQSLLTGILISCALLVLGVLISGPLPGVLGGEMQIRHGATVYFRIFVLFLPVLQMNRLAGSLLQCSGDMKTPGMLNVLMCMLDVLFNAVLIFPSRTVDFLGIHVWIPGAGLQVAGAALGTALAEVVVAGLMLWALCVRSSVFRLKKGEDWGIKSECLQKALRLGGPLALENILTCGAMVVTTAIVAPLGTIAIAANSFAVTAESLCYMPGYGIADAAATLVGQSIGAGERNMVRRFTRMTVWLGMAVMTLTGIFMYMAAPFMMGILSPDTQVCQLGVQVLRIEAFAEPLFAASIVASGALRGAGDTFIPSIMNFISIWFVRLTLSVLLSKTFGLPGVWFAMCAELCFRGMIFLVRIYREKWIHI